MPPKRSNTATPLDCFATATKLVVDASLIDPRCATILPKIAVTYANVAKDHKSKVYHGPNTPSSMIQPDPTPEPITYLVEAIRVLSLAAPVYGSFVSILIPLIIGCMTQTEPSGFAPIEVGAETSPMRTENSSAKEREEVATVSGHTTEPASSSHRDSFMKERNNKVESKTISSCEEQSNSPEEDGRNADSTALSLKYRSAIVASKEATIDQQEEPYNSADTTYSYSSNRVKRTERAEEEKRHVFDRIPKRQKQQQPFKFHSRILAPMNKNRERYDARCIFHQEGRTLHGKSWEEKNRAYSMTQYTVPLNELKERHTYWQYVMEYRPSEKCIPTDTYLVIIITSNGPFDAPEVLKKYKDHEELKDSEFKEFLSIKKIIMIPRPLGDSFMYYLIPNLHKWLHGSLHIQS
jgi:hypothetical protein